MTTYIFTTPTVEEGYSNMYPLMKYFKRTVGISIANSDGVYSQQRLLTQDDIDEYTAFYRGGYKHSVSSDVRAALIAGDVGVTSANFVEE